MQYYSSFTVGNVVEWMVECNALPCSLAIEVIQKKEKLHQELDPLCPYGRALAFV
jgi:hypothetical protein